MSLLFAIKSCQRDRAFHQAIRDTWGYPLEMRFFMGGTSPQYVGDEVYLDCPDDYRSLPLKTKAIAHWFLSSDYDRIFLCDNDSYVDVPKLLAYPWRDTDYAGCFSFWPTGAQLGTTFRYDDGQGNTHNSCHAWASGGYGYFLSRKAAQYVAEMNPCSWAEDLSVGQVLGPLIQSGQIVAKNFEYRNTAIWHINKSAEHPFVPQRIYDYHAGRRS